MRKMTHHEIREVWLSFFKEHGHQIIESSSLIPKDDKTLLWINAGVAPLKKYFDGSETPSSPRLTNIQKCIRTNDIEQVGNTARHHTFFEMMGNFSIGDYFKEEAIKLGYELLFSSKYFNFPQDKIYITYYPTDKLAKEVWLKLGIKEDHLIAQEGNYWEIGEGPSGPDTEIFFDRGLEYDKRGTELIKDDLENDRYIEIWNIVFSQYNAKENLKREEYEELPSKNIDTGAGLERFACILQNTKTNFETDLFKPIIDKITEITNVEYNGQASFKIIADHIKTLVMSIGDGAVLSNEGRGYVLRRLLRRALKHGKALGISEAFLTKLIEPVILIMGDYYPNIIENKKFIAEIIYSEEIKFLETLLLGEEMIKKVSKDKKELSKEDAFLLYDTYGFPIELQEEYALDHNLAIDKEGFYELLELQKERSRQSRSEEASMKTQDKEYLEFTLNSKFVGYNHLEVETEVIKVFPHGIVLKETPFYATMGGQEHDLGVINEISIKDVVKLPHGQHLHLLDGNFKEGEKVIARVNKDNREQIIKNHTATHLLHQALIDIFGNHVTQQGSYVGSDLLRFDFNHFKKITDEEILKIENIVNSHIKKAIPVITEEMFYDKAISLGAKALFSEKYENKVRVVFIDKYSVELCGGTHVNNTKEIGSFMISSVSSIGSGIYRVEAFTGSEMLAEFKRRNENLFEEESLLKAKYSNLLLEAKKLNMPLKQHLDNLHLIASYQDRLNLLKHLNSLKELTKHIEREIQLKKDNLVLNNLDELIKTKQNNLIITHNLEPKSLRPLLVNLYNKLNHETVLLLNIEESKATYLIMSKGLARDIISKLNEISMGSGGGNPNFAQGGTTNLERLDDLIGEMIKI